MTKKDQIIEDVMDEEIIDGEQTPENETEELDEMHMDDKDLSSGVKDSWSKTNLLSIAAGKLGAMSKSEIMDFFNKSMNQIGHEADKVGDVAGKNKNSIGTHPSHASAAIGKAIKEDLDVIFGGDDEMSDDFKNKVTTLFESAVNARMTFLESDMEEAYGEALEEEVTEITEGLVDKIDDYLGYVCQEWIAENEVAIQSTLSTEITEDFIEGLRGLFLEHNIEVPESKLDVLEMLASKVEELEENLNGVMSENMSLHEAMAEYEKYQMVEKKTEGLTPLQADKFEKLAECVYYNGDVDLFEKNLDIIKEAHFSNKNGKTAKTNLITEEISHDPNDPLLTEPRAVRPEMKKYVEGIKKTIRA